MKILFKEGYSIKWSNVIAIVLAITLIVVCCSKCGSNEECQTKTIVDTVKVESPSHANEELDSVRFLLIKSDGDLGEYLHIGSHHYYVPEKFRDVKFDGITCYNDTIISVIDKASHYSIDFDPEEIKYSGSYIIINNKKYRFPDNVDKRNYNDIGIVDDYVIIVRNVSKILVAILVILIIAFVVGGYLFTENDDYHSNLSIGLMIGSAVIMTVILVVAFI